jgi:hypothetical protein
LETSATDRDWPLTVGQRWLLHVLRESPALARPVQRIYRLRRPLDTASLLAAFEHVVAIHPALRMQLVESGDRCIQRFVSREAKIQGISIRDGTTEQRVAYARHVIAGDGARPFDLRREPAYLARIIEVDGDLVLGLSVDHLAADSLALDTLERDLAEAYVRERNGDAHSAADSGALFRFLDAEASRAKLEAANLRYWRERLAGAPLATKADPDLAWVPGTTARWEVDGAALSTFLAACDAQRCSAFVAMLAAEVSLLGGLGGTDDVVVNVPVSNRTRADEHTIVANLSHLLHLRFRIVPSEKPLDFLRRVRNQVMEAMAHRQYDYASLSAAIAAEAVERGGAVSWLNGCNYIRGRATTPAQAALFEERFDDQAESYDVPETAFTLTCRLVSTVHLKVDTTYGLKADTMHDAGSLCFHVDWDGRSWPISADDLRARFLDALSMVTGAASVANGG